MTCHQLAVDMFAMFSLRRPDILPVGELSASNFPRGSVFKPHIGDLGVQRGVLRWFLSLHSSKYNFSLSPQKLPPPEGKEDTSQATEKTPKSKEQQDSDVLPVLGQSSKPTEEEKEPGNPDVSSVLPAPTLPETPAPTNGKGKNKSAVSKDGDSDTEDEAGVLPTPFTPSINKTLKMVPASKTIAPLPPGLTVAELKSRLEKKKKVKLV